MQTWQTILLGIVEGLTEFIPVSSTGHLLLLEHFLGVKPTKRVFEVLIQLGAVLAILTVYAARLWTMLMELPTNPETRRFVIAILVAFLPAAAIGILAHKFIKEVLFETPMLICIMLIVGGVILLIVDRLPLEERIKEARQISIPSALAIGLCQCIAMIPGVSRSGATIVGGMLLGLSKRAAAEFSFFLAMPTMAGAFAYDLYKSHADLDRAAMNTIALGFVVAFIAGVIVVRYLLDFVSRYGFAPFAWWRIVVGGLGLGALVISG